MNLFILPHAGGSARGYCAWKRHLLKEDITIVPMEPAGRGARTGEAFCESIAACAENLLSRHGEMLAKEPYALFGHSMGTMLAIEVARQAQVQGLPGPQHVFLSGRCAPDEELIGFAHLRDASSEEIAAFFFAKGLLPEEVRQSGDLYEMLVSILTADVRMTEGYLCTPEEYRFKCDIDVFYGTEDDYLRGFDMNRWSAFTEGKCICTSFPGGHFYHTEQKEALCKIIAERLQ